MPVWKPSPDCPLTVAWGIPGQPDSITYYTETAPETAASYATVNSPLPPPGTTVVLQANIPGVFPFDMSHTIKAGDTPTTVATALAAFFNAGAYNPDDVAALKAAGVLAETNGPDIAFVNPPTGLIELVDLSGAFTIHPGSAGAWDAQTQINFGVFPKNKAAPPAGSNIGQVSFCAYKTDGTIAKYVTLGFNVVDPVTGKAGITIYTEDTKAIIGTVG